MELTCAVQNYDWGKFGLNSLVAQLLRNSITVRNGTAYAELWMGTHPNGPSLIKATNKLLLNYIQEDPTKHLGKSEISKFGNDLPYLFKVLSIGSPLSIQAHPNKELAEILHKQRPDLYKDANHKPEMAVALGEFQAMCGFRSLTELKGFARDLSTLLRPLYGPANFDSLVACQKDPRQFIKSCLTNLLRQSKDNITAHINRFLNEIDETMEETRNGVVVQIPPRDKSWKEAHYTALLRSLHCTFPGDPGCVAIYLLNVLKLQKFEAIYLGANVPHAYILGDCVEIMACSDNVVRAGLTNKLIDVNTLLDMLDYTPMEANLLKFNCDVENDNSWIYRPPVNDFALIRIQIPRGARYDFTKRNCGSIFLVIEGDGSTVNNKVLKVGNVFFLSANETLTVSTVNSSLLIFQAICNVK